MNPEDCPSSVSFPSSPLFLLSSLPLLHSLAEQACLCLYLHISSLTEAKPHKPENDNLRHEYRALFSQVQRSVPFARIALQQDPDAINLWIGNSRSVTALHRDNYENIYVQVRGRKHFVLLPPLCQPCVNEQPLRPAHYARQEDGGGGDDDETLELVMEEDADDVPFATWDPDNDEVNTTKYSHLASPMRVTLEPGDMFYLPAMW